MKKENKNPPTSLSFSFPHLLRGIKREGGFTLVELIIVITILAILATIAFLSFKGYMKDARDGNRVASISNIEKGLGIFNLQTSKYPTPDKKDGQTLLQTGALSISGSIIEYSYLGEIGSGLTQQLKISKTPQDPLSGSKYTYTTTLDGRKYQIASILENPTSYKNNLVKQANAGNDGYVAKVSGNHQDIVIKEFGTGKYITVVPSLVFDPSGSNILNQTGTLSIVNNKGNLPYSPSKSSNVGNTTTAEQLIREVRNNNLATTATLKLPDGVMLDGSGVLNEWWIPNKNGTNWNGYSSGVILASLGSVGVDGGADYVKLTDVLNGGSASITAQTMTSAVVSTTPSYNIGNSLRFNGSNSYLNKTFTTIGNRKKWTWSGWVKRTNVGLSDGDQIVFSTPGTSSYNDSIDIRANLGNVCLTHNGSGKVCSLDNAISDPSIWHHLLVKFDTTGDNQNDYIRIYVNGSEVSYSVTNYPAKNEEWNIGNNVQYRIGYANNPIYSDPNHYFKGYLSEVNFIDGQALLPTSFGQFDTNGRWVPKSYTGDTASYGTNGFHLDFSSGASLTSLGLDSSGKGNNWTLSPTFNTYDQMLDSPTNNFATLNPLVTSSNTNYSPNPPSNGNLTLKSVNASYNAMSVGNIGVSSGKWYREVYITNKNDWQRIGILNTKDPTTSIVGSNGDYYRYDMHPSYQGYVYNGNTNTYLSSPYGSPWKIGDTIGVALDMDNGKMFFSINGDWQGSGNPVSGINPAVSGLLGKTYVPLLFLGSAVSNQMNVNFGQTKFSMITQNPSNRSSLELAGFKALSTKNFPENYYPIENPKQYFDVLTYTGNSTVRSLTGLQFQPDLVWIKNRNGPAGHLLYDTNRGYGVNKAIYTNSTVGEGGGNENLYGYITNVLSNGFTTVGGTTNSDYVNTLNKTYVAWNWRAGGTSVTNNSGSIQSQVSVNKEAGFSIVKYIGNGTAGATVGHLLGKTPSFIILKRTDNGTDNWRVYHSALGGTKALALNTTDGAGTNNIIWNNANPNDSTFTLGTESNTNASGSLIISYVWSEVPGYSKFGSYTGNGSTDGPFVYTGFKPRYIMIKSTANVVNTSWYIVDTARDSINPVVNALGADITNSESTVNPSGAKLDILSNGFKVRVVSGFNSTNEKYIYAAFAELPFK